MPMLSCSFFFFQAEDGIRDIGVTGVQTCALPIFYGGLSNTLTYGRFSLDLFFSFNYGNKIINAGNAYGGDRKSTRLNSSHANNSYAVFCLKKKKKKKKKKQRTQFTMLISYNHDTR